jgi:hypothetical protein
VPPHQKEERKERVKEGKKKGRMKGRKGGREGKLSKGQLINGVVYWTEEVR